MNIAKELFEKYNLPTPRYTSYPPANYFSSDVDNNKNIEAFKASNNENPQNISIYIHIPFCAHLCLYCGCNTKITKDKEIMKSYVETLLKEIDLLKEVIQKDRKISQIHWGGGTPNYLPIENIHQIMDKLYETFEIIDKPEIAMECHPAHLTNEYTEQLIKIGFNRLSLGVQDFSDEVLETVKREKAIIPISEMIDYIKTFDGVSVNLDFIYGLPFQDVEKYTKTIQKAAELSPDRLAVFSYAHVPWLKKPQKALEKFGLPSADKKIKLFQSAYDILTNAGYTSIGLDHFAKKDDELSIALESKKLHRNFQGYSTVKTTGQVYALGVSGISQLESAYLQNTKDIPEYIKSVEAGIFPIEKAYFLNRNEKIIRAIIESMMCNMYVSFDEISDQFNISTEEIYAITKVDTKELEVFEEEGLININKAVIELTKQGQFFMRNIAAAFDPNMKNNTKSFSKSL